jgi:hypothetical protein
VTSLSKSDGSRWDRACSRSIGRSIGWAADGRLGRARPRWMQLYDPDDGRHGSSGARQVAVTCLATWRHADP